MPTTKLKNLAYRAMLPFCAPSCGKSPVSSVSGHPVGSLSAFTRLIRRHHVLGSATLLSDGKSQALILTDSEKPAHHPAPDTYFRVASITKIATAALIMRLADRVTAATLNCVNVSARNLAFGGDNLAIHLGTPPNDPSYLYAMVVDSNGRMENLYVTTDEQNWVTLTTSTVTPLGMDATLSGCTLPPERIMPVTRILPYHEGRDLILTPLGRIPLDAPDPLRHFGHTAGSMYTTVQSLHRLLSMLISSGGDVLSPAAVSEMKKQHASYGPLSPTLSYGLGLLRINDPAISPSLVLGHQGFAYGCGDGAFWEENSGRLIIFLNGGCSEARTGRLGTSNRDFASWAFRKELPSW